MITGAKDVITGVLAAILDPRGNLENRSHVLRKENSKKIGVWLLYDVSWRVPGL